jgi:hypothetical protein
MRISRVAEEYWHSTLNIESSQAKSYPTIAIEGAAHHSFMSAPYPSFVVSSDLKDQLNQDESHSQVGNAIAQFFHQQITGVDSPILGHFVYTTKYLMEPLVKAMDLEGNGNLKPPCFDYNIVNTPSPKCTTGSEWCHMHAQTTMAGDLNGVTINEGNNFHRVESVTPVHLPQFNNTCAFADDNCVLESLSVTENYYEKLNELDTGKFAVAAYEMKTKLKSRQES